jgi:hypothetical protein
MREVGFWNGQKAIVVRRDGDTVVVQVESDPSPRGKAFARIITTTISAWKKANKKA